MTHVAYTRGDRIELIRMSDDPDPVPPGTKGTVVWVDDAGTVHVKWDNGRNLGLVPDYDQWRKIHDAESPEEVRAPRNSQDQGAVHRD